MSSRDTTAGRTSLLDRLRQPIGSGARPHAHPHPRNGIGAVPSVSLLPVEIRDAGTSARRRKRLVALVAVVALLSAGAVGVAGSVADGASTRLKAASAQTAVLNGQIARFEQIRALQSHIALGRAAVAVGGATMVDWNRQLTEIESYLPVGYAVASVSTSGATPIADYPQGTTPLEPRRAATVTMTLTTGTVGHEFSVFLRMLRSIPAYADASATYTANGGVTTIVLTVHLTEHAIVPAGTANANDATETP